MLPLAVHVQGRLRGLLCPSREVICCVDVGYLRPTQDAWSQSRSLVSRRIRFLFLQVAANSSTHKLGYQYYY